MFIHGKFKENITIQELGEMEKNNSNSIEAILTQLDQLSVIWKVDGQFFNRAVKDLSKNSTFSEKSLKETLSCLPALLNRKSLSRRIHSELGDIRSLDQFVKQVRYNYKLALQPLGRVLHITAGNVFLGAIDSLVMGLITKNSNVIKIGSRNLVFPKLFCESLNELSSPSILTDHICFIKWRGGDVDLEHKISKVCDAVVIWGGASVVKNYRDIVDLDTKLIEFGPKLSFGIVQLEYFEQFESNIFKYISKDVFRWNQSACSNSQTYFIDSRIDINSFLLKLYDEFKRQEYSNLLIDADSQVERLKERERNSFNEFQFGVSSFFDENFIISFKGKQGLQLSILNQTLNINVFDDLEQLSSFIAPMEFYLQTCALGVIEGKEDYLLSLSKIGVKRFVDVGQMTNGVDGAPHDGIFPLKELVHFISDETDSNLDISFESTKRLMPFFKDNSNRIIDANSLIDNRICESDKLVSRNSEPGLFFTSGGSSGEPKYCYYSYDDLERVAYILSENFMDLGLSSKDTVANLFMAGNLWSSFLSTQKVLENIGCNVLPIGGMADDALTVKYLLEFSATCITGIPTKILSLAKYVSEHKIVLKLDFVFYAGERFSDFNLTFIKDTFSCDKIYSAGYASVDCGLIGIQTKDCLKDEHILVDGVVIESKEEGLIVSSNLRSNMPVINYRLEDKLIFSKHNPRMFKLAGRSDKTIQVWGCRFQDLDLLKASNLSSDVVQFRIRVDEVIEVTSSTSIINPKIFTQSFLSMCQDVRNTVSSDFLLKNFVFKQYPLEVSSKTGKTNLVIDERF